MTNFSTELSFALWATTTALACTFAASRWHALSLLYCNDEVFSGDPITGEMQYDLPLCSRTKCSCDYLRLYSIGPTSAKLKLNLPCRANLRPAIATKANDDIALLTISNGCCCVQWLSCPWSCNRCIWASSRSQAPNAAGLAPIWSTPAVLFWTCFFFRKHSFTKKMHAHWWQVLQRLVVM